MKFLTLALGLLPSVLAGVQAVEVALAGQKGATKKAAVLAAVTAATKVTAGLLGAELVSDNHVKVVSALIDSVVGSLNTSGVFVTSKQVAPQGGGALAGVAA